MKPIHFLTTFLALLLIVSIGININIAGKKSQQDQSISDLIQNQGENQIVKEYTRDSITHTVFKDRIINGNSNEKLIALGKPYADSLEKALKVSIDKIDMVTKINGKLEAQVALLTTQTPKGETVKTHKDKYLDLVYYPVTDSLNLAYNLELNDARYSDRKWLLGAKQNYIDMFSPDKRITINGAKTYRVKEQPPNRFGIGLSAGYGVGVDGNLVRLVPYIGLGVNYNLIEF